jgi:uncharacterized protein involved in exopolysaccharide biosynthesis
MANELDLPPISIGRYVDLLKRRRWQVVPISLAGLLLGGIVAFFIPRYYVAETLIGYKALPGADNKERASSDPIADELGRYKNILPIYVPDVLAKLKWPEVMNSEDPDGRKGFEAAVQERLSFQDVGPQDRNRTETQIKLTYRDVNGQRSAEFLNELRNHWAIQIKTELRTRYDAKMLLLINERTQAEERMHQYSEERKAFIQDKGLNAQDLQSTVTHTGEHGLTMMAQQSEQDINRLTGEIADLEEKELPALRKVYQSTEQYVDVPLVVSPEMTKRLEAAAKNFQDKRDAASKLSTENPQRAFYEQQMLRAKEDLELIRAEIQALKPDKRPNPDWVRYKSLIQDRNLDLERKKGQLARQKANFADLSKRMREMASALAYLGELGIKFDQARLQFEDAEKRCRQTTIDRMGIETQEPFQLFREARPPKRPTDPNIMLVALAGCALGLAAAVVLVLLLDMLRSTFKTMDDVERGLAVPVLGSLAHMETREEQHEAQRKRARASLVAASFLTLIAAVVTIYYVAPARLPGVVSKALDYILGPVK